MSSDRFAKDVQGILKNIHQPVFPNRSWSLLAAGGIADGKGDNKPLLDSLITSCSKAGGGRVVIAKGKYFVKGPIVLKSHVNLHLEDEAEVIFSSDPQDYLPCVLSKWEGTELFNYSPQIYAYECTDIAVTGKGHLNGSAGPVFARWRPQGSKEQLELRQMGGNLVPLQQRVFGERTHFPPSMIQFIGCANVLVEGITITDAPYWVIHPVYCNNVTVRGVTINSMNLNNDGVDPEASTNVLIEQCDFTVGDDAIAIKAGRDQDAWRIGRATENVIVRKCIFRSKTNGLCIGSEMSGGVRNVYMEDIDLRYCFSAVYFKSNLDRGGFIEHIRIRNIRCDSARSACIRFENNYHGGRGGNYPTQFRDFVISNIQCRTSGEVGIYAVGIPGTPLQNIQLRNIAIGSTPVPQILSQVEKISWRLTL